MFEIICFDLDVVQMSLLGAGAIRFCRSLRALRPLHLIVLTYVLLFVASLARGVYSNGLFAAANEARGFVGPLIAMLYFSDAPVDDQSVRAYVQGYRFFGIALCILAAAYFVFRDHAAA